MPDDLASLVSQLQSTLGKMEVALGAIGEAIVWTEQDGRIQWSNTTFDLLVERQRFEVLGANLLDLLPLHQQGQRVAIAQHPITQAIELSQSYTEIYEFYHASRQFILKIFSTKVQFKGQQISAVLVIRDITKRYQAEQCQAIQFSVTRILAQATTLDEAIPGILRTVCEGAGWGIGSLWQPDPHQALLRWQASWHHDASVYPNFEAINREITFALGEGLPGRVWSSQQPAWITDVAVDSNFPRAAIAAQEHLQTAFAFPILNQGEVIGVMEFLSSITYLPDDNFLLLMLDIGSQISQFWKRRQAEAQIQQQLAELEKLNRVKDEFLNTVSHELRTPISNMRMAIEMLKHAPTLERQEQYLEILQAQCLREANLINDLLDLQRLDAPGYDPVHRGIMLQDWLPRIVEPFQSRIQAHGQTLHTHLSNSNPTITIDCVGLERVILELLNNACKYTPKGGEIHLTVYCCSQTSNQADSSKATLVLMVSNQATIPAAELPHIFEKFYRVPQTDIWHQGGTGLGLALVKKLVEQMQGKIDVESDAHQTTFTVQTPAIVGFGCNCL